MFDTKGSRHLDAAAKKVWPDAKWKPFKDSMPVRHLDVFSDDGKQLRIFDCTAEHMGFDAIKCLRLAVRKSTLKGITCCVIATNKSETDRELMDAIYAIYPLFMFARFLEGGQNSLEIATTYDDYIFRRSAANYFALLKSDAFELWWPGSFVGEQYVEYMETICQGCRKAMYAATGIIPLWVSGSLSPDLKEEIRIHGLDIHLRPLSECHDLLADGVPAIIEKTTSFGRILATPIRRDKPNENGDFGYSAYCPSCNVPFDGNAFVEKTRNTSVRKPRRELFDRLKYVRILAKGVNWDYDYVEAHKFDEQLYREAGIKEPSWGLKPEASD